MVNRIKKDGVCEIKMLSQGWTKVDHIETQLKLIGSPHDNGLTETIFIFPDDCKIMLDAAGLVLSLSNQLITTGRFVKLIFTGGATNPAYGYLTRAYFFNLLAPEVKVEPERPSLAIAEYYRGRNPYLVEFRAIPVKGDPQKDLTPKELTDALEATVGSGQNKENFCNAAYTIFGELVSNIYHHSETAINGYAALQLYRGSSTIVKILVSDSGKGLLDTIRPKANLTSKYNKMSDAELLKLVFKEGFSRLDEPGRGLGLKVCAKKVTNYNGRLRLRLPQSSVLVAPTNFRTDILIEKMEEKLPLIWGTHLSFEFPIDNI